MKQFFTLSRQSRYVVIGIWNTLFGFGVFTLLIAVTPESWYLISLSISTIIAVLQSYVTQRIFVWRSKSRSQSEFIRFSLVFAFQFVFNIFLLYLCVEMFGFNPLWTQYVVGSVLILATYYFHKVWTFRA